MTIQHISPTHRLYRDYGVRAIYSITIPNRKTLTSAPVWEQTARLDVQLPYISILGAK